MKIIHVILGKARLDRMNGVNQVAHHLASHQAKLGYEVEVWGITPKLEELNEERPYHLRLFKDQKRPFALSRKLKKAIHTLDTEESVIHFHAAFIPQFYAISKILRKRWIKYFYTPHGNLSPGALNRSRLKKKLYLKFLELPMLKHAAGVHFLGKVQFDNFDNIFPLAQKCLIPNGQELAHLPKKIWSEEESAYPIFCFCGRLDADHKGLDLLFEGFNHYTWSGGKGRLSIIGDGVDREKLKAYLTANDLSDKVTFHGSAFGEEKYALLQQSDIFVHTSRYEGMPCSVLEAAGMGLPCIVSPATNLDIFMEKAGAAIPLIANTPEGICKTFKTAEMYWQEGKLPTMGMAARELISTQYQWPDIAHALVQAYKGFKIIWKAKKPTKITELVDQP